MEMDFTILTTPVTIEYSAELFTARFLMEGLISGPFPRMSDLINRRDRDFLAIREAVRTPITEGGTGAIPDPGKQMRFDSTLMVKISSLQFVALPARSPRPETQEEAMPTARREYYVQKIRVQCEAFTDTFSFRGYCYLLPNSSLEKLLDSREGSLAMRKLDNLLDAGDTFIPLTKVRVSLLERPDVYWERSLVVINKDKLEGISLLQGTATDEQVDVPAVAAMGGS